MTPSPLSPSAMLEAVRAKIVEANPDIYITDKPPACPMEDCSWYQLHPADDDKTWECPKCDYTEPCRLREIRLADVLLSMQGMTGEKSGDHFAITHYGEFHEVGYDTFLAEWNLRADSLNDQDDACIRFLHSLLCK